MTHRGVWKALKVARVSIISRGWKAGGTSSWSSLMVQPEKLTTDCSILLSALEQGSSAVVALATVLSYSNQTHSQFIFNFDLHVKFTIFPVSALHFSAVYWKTDDVSLFHALVCIYVSMFYAQGFKDNSLIKNLKQNWTPPCTSFKGTHKPSLTCCLKTLLNWF